MSHRPVEGYLPCSVWRIKGPRNTVYLAGASEDVTNEQIPWPSPFYAAYRDSQELYVDFDAQLSWFAQVRMMSKLTKWFKSHQGDFICPKGRTLSNYLSATTVERLRAFYGKDYRKREQLTPAFLIMMSEAEAMDDASDDGDIEEFFLAAARKERKPIRSLDENSTVDTALQLLEEMLLKLNLEIARRGADAVIEESILGQKKKAEDSSTWRRGDLKGVERIQAEMKDSAPSLYEKGLVERNRQWMSKLKPALQGKNNAMVLVDIIHLGGKEGLLQLLQDAGYSPEQLYGVDRPATNPGRPTENPKVR